jgi:hypothetical protein
MNLRWILGKRIVEVNMNPFPDGMGGTTHNPVFTLEDGSQVRFAVQETEVGEYGIELVYRKKPRKKP